MGGTATLAEGQSLQAHLTAACWVSAVLGRVESECCSQLAVTDMLSPLMAMAKAFPVRAGLGQADVQLTGFHKKRKKDKSFL